MHTLIVIACCWGLLSVLAAILFHFAVTYGRDDMWKQRKQESEVNLSVTPLRS